MACDPQRFGGMPSYGRRTCGLELLEIGGHRYPKTVPGDDGAKQGGQRYPKTVPGDDGPNQGVKDIQRQFREMMAKNRRDDGPKQGAKDIQVMPYSVGGRFPNQIGAREVSLGRCNKNRETRGKPVKLMTNPCNQGKTTGNP